LISALIIVLIRLDFDNLIDRDKVSPSEFWQDNVLTNSEAAWSLRRGRPAGYQHHAAPGFDFADQAET
jgi:hypothetical protein